MINAAKFRSRHPLPLLALSLVLALFTGCSVLGSNATYPDQYTLDTTPTSQPATQGGPFPMTLALRPVTAASWLTSNRMFYRLNFNGLYRLASYSQSEWITPPATMVNDNLAEALSNRHMFPAVLNGNTSGNTDLALKVRLTDFSQYFSNPSVSHSRIAATATLMNSHSGDVIAQHDFMEKVLTPTADAPGGARAMTQADQQLNNAIANWLAQTVSSCGQKCHAGS